MCKWQLTEYNFCFAKAANTWQIVVFPHLLRDTHQINKEHEFQIHTHEHPSQQERGALATDTAGQHRASSQHRAPAPWLSGPFPKTQHPTMSLIQKGTHYMNSTESNWTLKTSYCLPTLPSVSNQQHWFTEFQRPSHQHRQSPHALGPHDVAEFILQCGYLSRQFTYQRQSTYLGSNMNTTQFILLWIWWPTHSAILGDFLWRRGIEDTIFSWNVFQGLLESHQPPPASWLGLPEA